MHLFFFYYYFNLPKISTSDTCGSVGIKFRILSAFTEMTQIGKKKCIKVNFPYTETTVGVITSLLSPQFPFTTSQSYDCTEVMMKVVY